MRTACLISCFAEHQNVSIAQVANGLQGLVHMACSVRLLAVCLLITCCASAPTVFHRVIPRSWQEADLPEAAWSLLPTVDSKQEAATHATSAGMLKIAKAAELPREEGYSADMDGEWDALSRSGGVVWRMNIASPGALSQTLTFSKLRLPPGSDLFIYSPFLTLNSTVCHWGCLRITPTDVPLSGRMVTHPLPGGMLSIEYYHPWANANYHAPELQIAQVLQGFRLLDSFIPGHEKFGHNRHHVSTPSAPLTTMRTNMMSGTLLEADATSVGSSSTSNSNLNPSGRRSLDSESDQGSDDWVAPDSDLWETAEDVASSQGSTSNSGKDEGIDALLQDLASGLTEYFEDYGAGAPSDDQQGTGYGQYSGDDMNDAESGSDSSAGGGGFSQDPGYSYEDLESTVLKGVGEAKSCMRDVSCNETLQGAANGVVMLIAVGNKYAGLCTGNLINTVNQKQYLLTAYHCMSDDSGKRVDDTTWTYYWTAVFQHQKPCDSQKAPQDVQLLTGLKYVWGDVNIDMLLLEVMDDIPDEFSPYYLGWTSAWDFVPQETVCIQHPKGDTKKYAYDGESPKSIRVIPDANGDMRFSALNATHWEIVSWNEGATAQGSSGSVLMDAASQALVGTLTGGMSDCGNSQADVFSKLSVAWRSYGLWEYLNGTSPEEGMTMPPRNHSSHRLALLVNPNGMTLMEGQDPLKVVFGLFGEFDSDEVISVDVEIKSEKEQQSVTLSSTSFELSSDTLQDGFTVSPVDDDVSSGYVYFDIVLTARSSTDDSLYIKKVIPGAKVDDEVPVGETQDHAIDIDHLPFQQTIDEILLYRPTPDVRSIQVDGPGLGSDVIFKLQANETLSVDVTTCPDADFDTYLVIMEDKDIKWFNDDGGAGVTCSTISGAQLQAGVTYWIVVAVVNPSLIDRGSFTLVVNPAT